MVEVKLKKPRQLKFYCTEDAFQHFQSVKVRRQTSTQELLSEALDLFLEESSRWQSQEADIARDLGKPNWKELEPKSQVVHVPSELGHWINLWVNFMSVLPAETVDAFRQVMQDTYKYFTSSRLKAAPQIGRRKHDDPEEG